MWLNNSAPHYQNKSIRNAESNPNHVSVRSVLFLFFVFYHFSKTCFFQSSGSWECAGVAHSCIIFLPAIHYTVCLKVKRYIQYMHSIPARFNLMEKNGHKFISVLQVCRFPSLPAQVSQCGWLIAGTHPAKCCQAGRMCR